MLQILILIGMKNHVNSLGGKNRGNMETSEPYLWYAASVDGVDGVLQLLLEGELVLLAPPALPVLHGDRRGQ